MLKDVKAREEAGIWWVEIDRPRRRNALGVQTVQELNLVLDEIEAAETGRSRVLVIGGTGDDFCTGADLSERREMAVAERVAHSRAIAALVRRVAEFPLPTIARIGGYAVGGGCELALACDLRVVSRTAVIGLTEARIGVFPGAGGMHLLTRIAGPAVAKQMIFTARRFAADEVAELGLVTSLVEPEELRAETRKLAEEIAANGPLGIRYAKQAIDRVGESPIATGYAMDQAVAPMLLASEDYREGLAAFAERRNPEFKGR